MFLHRFVCRKKQPLGRFDQIESVTVTHNQHHWSGSPRGFSFFDGGRRFDFDRVTRFSRTNLYFLKALARPLTLFVFKTSLTHAEKMITQILHLGHKIIL